MRRLFCQILVAIFGLFLATQFVVGVSLKVIPGKSIYFGIEFTQDWQILIFVGMILGLINFFLKPILNLITLPLKILSLGFFSLILNMFIVWIVDAIFPEFQISGIVPLFWTTMILWILNVFFQLK